MSMSTAEQFVDRNWWECVEELDSMAVEIEQDFSTGFTRWTFEDGSSVVAEGETSDVSQSQGPVDSCEELGN